LTSRPWEEEERGKTEGESYVRNLLSGSTGADKGAISFQARLVAKGRLWDRDKNRGKIGHLKALFPGTRKL